MAAAVVTSRAPARSCLDTAHLCAAGYNVAGDFEVVRALCKTRALEKTIKIIETPKGDDGMVAER